MKFALLLYCATVPAQSHPAYDCVSLSVHPDAQTAINAAHEWCLFDHICVHHTYLQEIELGPQFHHVGTDAPHDAEGVDVPSAASIVPQDPGVPPVGPAAAPNGPRKSES